MPKLISKVIRKLTRPFKHFTLTSRNRRLAQDKAKYFCIGRNKTGTTSLKKAFEDLGFPIGDQRTAELLADKYYFEKNFLPIIKYCQSAQVFQDAPFSWPETFKHLDQAYPGSKFILTVRDNADQWHQSITRFHSKRFGNGHLPSADQLRNAKYINKGYMYKAVKQQGTPANGTVYFFHVILSFVFPRKIFKF